MTEMVTEKIDSFFSKFTRQIYKKGQILLWPDTQPDEIYFLRKGMIKEYLISKKGTEAVTYTFLPKSVFPLSCAVNNTKNIYYFEASTQAVVLKAPKDKVIEFIKNNPDVLYELMSDMYRGLESVKLLLAYRMARSAYALLVEELVTAAKWNGEKDDQTGSVIVKDFIEKFAASRTGLTQETVSREMNFLKTKKLVTLKDKTLIINNLELLEKELRIF